MAWAFRKARRRGLALALASAGAVATAQAQDAPGAAAPYQDHYIADGKLAPEISYGDEGYTDTGGLARSLRVDAMVTAISHHAGSADSNLNENGVVVESQWDTASYGAFSLGGAAQASGGDSTSGNKIALGLQQRDLAVDGGWRVNNGIGTINTGTVDLLHQQQRFYLPTTPILGASTEWLGPAAGTQVVASVGEPGIFQGIRVPGFQSLGGSTATLGAQWAPAEAWRVGGQVINAHDVSSLSGFTSSTDARQSSSSALLSTAWHNAVATAQLNLIDGSVSGTSGGGGGWLDATFRSGDMLHSAGVFHVDPNISWGNQPIVSDAQGGYYRNSYLNRRWQTELGVDYLDSVSGRGTSSTFYSGSARYQLSRDFGVGGVANIRQAGGDHGWATQGYLDWRNHLGVSRAQLNYAEDSPRRDAGLTLDQAWQMPLGARLSTSLSLERLTGTGIEDHTALGLSVYGGGDLTARLSIDGNVRWARAIEGTNAPATAANVAVTWQVDANWSVLATFYENHAGSWSTVTISSPINPPEVVTTPASDDQGVFLTVRFQRSGGAHFAPLGGRPGTGWGPVSGTIYLDANANGVYDASEAVAANVNVVLDGRYSTRTDSQGRYEFPAVAAGRHVLVVVPDNLPLPWMVPEPERREITVETRERTVVDVGAQRGDANRT